MNQFKYTPNREWEYCEPAEDGKTNIIRISEETIIKRYFNCWREKYNKIFQSLYTKEQCIEDFITINWAKKVKAINE